MLVRFGGGWRMGMVLRGRGFRGFIFSWMGSILLLGGWRFVRVVWGVRVGRGWNGLEGIGWIGAGR